MWLNVRIWERFKGKIREKEESRGLEIGMRYMEILFIFVLGSREFRLRFLVLSVLRRIVIIFLFLGLNK